MEREAKRSDRPVFSGGWRDDGPETTEGERTERTERAERGERGPKSSPRRKMLKVLVIDDSEIVLETTREMLEAGGFEVATCDSPIGAMLRVAAEKPDLVLVDLNMASIAGDRVIASLKSGQRTAHIPVYLYTSASPGEIVDAVRRSRADGCIAKCSEGLELATAVRKAIGR